MPGELRQRKTRPIGAGRFNRPITIERPRDTYTAEGARIRTWDRYYACFAEVITAQVNRPFFAQQLYPTASIQIAIRWHPTLAFDATMRITLIKGRVTHYYQILGVINENAENVTLAFYCQELQVQPTS